MSHKNKKIFTQKQEPNGNRCAQAHAIEGNQITDQESVKTDSVFSKHRKREIISNWSRYEINENDDDSSKIVNFEDLLDASSDKFSLVFCMQANFKIFICKPENESKYLLDKSRTNQKKEDLKEFKFGSDEWTNLFSLNTQKLNSAFQCQPFSDNFPSYFADPNKTLHCNVSNVSFIHDNDIN
jgi:hypothetical protein